MAEYSSNLELAQEISARIGNEPIPFESVSGLCMEIYQELGGDMDNFDDVYSILLEILPLAQSAGVGIIDDTVTTYDKTWSSSKISSELSSKQDELTAGDNVTISDNTISVTIPNIIDDIDSSSGTTYSSNRIDTLLSGKQGALTAGNNITIDNGTISATDTTYSAGTNVSIDNGVINVTIPNVINDLLTSTGTTWSSSKITAELASVGFDVQIVQTLPASGDNHTIYFIPSTTSELNNVYDEYMYINNAWEQIGSTAIDLSDYYDKTEVNTLLAGKQGTLTAGSNITISNGTISATDTTYSASDNIDITNNAIKAVGYRYDTSNGAFAEGDRDIVVNDSTKSLSTATGIMAHAEGMGGTASGNYSHVEGAANNATAAHTHAEGSNTTASAIASHTEGYLTETGGSYTSNTKTAGTQTGAGSYSHAEGNATIAQGLSAHSEGKLTFAKGNQSHTEGNNTVASGDNSHAEGASTSATGVQSHAEGSSTEAKGTNSHTEGRLSVANGYASHAEGDGSETGGNYASETTNPKTVDSRTAAAGDYAHAEGLATIAYGINSHAEGQKTFAKGNYTHVEGFGSIALENSAHAEGVRTLVNVNANGSHTEGYECETGGSAASNTKTASTTTNVGAFAHAEGNATIAQGLGAHSEGKTTFAKGNYSHTEGNGTRAQGAQSHAEGGTTTVAAAGANGHAEGRGTTVNGYASHAEGDGCETGGNYSNNTTNPKTPNSRTTTTGDYSHAEGMSTIAYGIASHAEGRLAFAKGNYSHAEGASTVAIGSNAHVEGRYTQTTNAAEHAQGSYNKSHTDNTADSFGTNGSKTIHSIGIGTADNARVNAVEVMQNGDVYIKGVGSYDGIHIKTESGYDYVQTLQNIITSLLGITDDLYWQLFRIKALAPNQIRYTVNDGNEFQTAGSLSVESTEFDVNTGTGIITYDADLDETGVADFNGFTQDNITSIELPKSDILYKISDGCFQNQTNLRQFTIPISITEIGSSAFDYCASLEIVKYEGTVDMWTNNVALGSDVFSNTPIQYICCVDGTVAI